MKHKSSFLRPKLITLTAHSCRVDYPRRPPVSCVHPPTNFTHQVYAVYTILSLCHSKFNHLEGVGQRILIFSLLVLFPLLLAILPLSFPSPLAYFFLLCQAIFLIFVRLQPNKNWFSPYTQLESYHASDTCCQKLVSSAYS